MADVGYTRTSTNSYLTSQDTGWIQGAGLNKEDVANKVTLVDPIDTPGLARFGSGKATGVTHEWSDRGLTNPKTARTAGADSLVAISAGAVEGSDFRSSTRPTPKRRKNVCQIFKQEFQVTRTQAEVATYGIANKVAEEERLAQIEVNRAIEARMWGVIACDPYGYWASTFLQAVAPLERMSTTIHGMVVRATSGTSLFTPNVVTLGTAGVPAAATEDDLLDLMMSIADDGGQPDVIMCHHRQKRKLNRLLTGLGIGAEAPSPRPMTNGIVPGVVRGYETDLGTMDLIGNRWVTLAEDSLFFNSSKGAGEAYQLITTVDPLVEGGINSVNGAGTIYVLTSSLIGVDYLHRPALDDIAKVGDALRGSVVGELTYRVEAPGQGHGAIINVAD